MSFKYLPTIREYLPQVVESISYKVNDGMPLYASGLSFLSGKVCLDKDNGVYLRYEDMTDQESSAYLDLLVEHFASLGCLPYHKFIAQNRGVLPEREFSIVATDNSWNTFRQLRFGIYLYNGTVSEGRLTWEYGSPELVLYGEISHLLPVVQSISKKFEKLNNVDIYQLADLLSLAGWRNTTQIDNDNT